MQKSVPNCNVSFANGKLHHAYGHVTLMISAWPKYSHRSLVGHRPPASLFIQLASLCIRIDSLSCLVLRWPSLSKILASDQSMTWFSFATWSVMAHFLVSGARSFWSARVNGQCSVADGFHFFSVHLLPFSITPGCFLNVCAATFVARNLVDTHLSGQLYVYPWDGLEDSLMSCRVSRLCLNVAIGYRFLRMVVLYEYNYRS